LLSSHGVPPHIPEQEVLELLGQVFYAMGDLPQAGRYWFLTERSGEDADKARSALFARYGTGSTLLAVLPFGHGLDTYPEVVRSRAEALDVDQREVERRLSKASGRPAAIPRGSRITDWLIGAFFVLLLVTLLVGFVTVLKFLFGLL
jgi:hypothetical protein